MEETRQYQTEPNVRYDGVQWLRSGEVYKGKVIRTRIATVRLYAPRTEEPAHVDVPSYWVKPVHERPMATPRQSR